MPRKLFYRLLFSVCACCSFLHASAQTGPGEYFSGRWTSRDTGYEISDHFIRELYKSTDSSWRPVSFPDQQYDYFSSPIKNSPGVFRSWMTKMFTSLREYHIDGGETSIESVSYNVFTITRLSENVLRLDICPVDTVSAENVHPPIILTEQTRMKYRKNSRPALSIVLYRLKD